MSQARYRPTEKTGLVTHKGCLDGTGSALMFLWAGGRRENILFRNPTGCTLSPEEAAPFDEVWFADLCPPSLELAAGGKPWRVFDHHLSNQRKFSENPLCTFDMKRSGTSLMAHVLGIDAEDSDTLTKELIGALEAYDLGRFDEPAGVRLADIAATYSQEEMLDIMLQRDPEEILYDRDLTHRAEAMSAVRKLYAEQASRYARIEEYYGVTVGNPDRDSVKIAIAVSPVYWKNSVARAILERPDHPDIAVVIDTTTQMVSLRSLEGGPDCSRMAALWGGGGHARAAGFKGNGGKMLEALSNSVFG